MDDELWFEEEIYPAEESIEEVVEAAKALEPETWYEQAAELAGLEPALAMLAGPLLELPKARRAAAIEKAVRERLHGIIRAHKPGALRLSPGLKSKGNDALPYARGTAYLVRLSVEFDLPKELKEAKYYYRKVYCRATVTAGADACLPTVLEVYPDRLFEGGPRMVKVELKPELTWKDAGANLGGITTDVQVGAVAPATVGFLGDDQRAPYWEMTEKQKEILGRYHFWFVLDVPAGCDPAGIRLDLLGEGDMKFRIGPFPMGPRREERAGRPTMTLAEVLGGSGG